MEDYENTATEKRNQFTVKENDDSDNYYEELSLHEDIGDVRYVCDTSRKQQGQNNPNDENPNVNWNKRKKEKSETKSNVEERLQERRTDEHITITSQRNNTSTKWKILFGISMIFCIVFASALVHFFVKEFSDTPCTRGSCLNGGLCFMSGGDYRCACPRGFYGPKCEKTPCTDQPCLHNGLCSVWQHTHNCSCLKGFAGTHCEETPCSDQPCLNNGSCTVLQHTYDCSCIEGFAGARCEVNPCDSSPCLNDGSCIVNKNSFNCDCTCGYVGNRCQDYRCASWDETVSCMITQDTSDDWDWSYHSGSTSSVDTGPSAAYEGSHYYYFETSYGSTGSTARLILKTIKSDSDKCLQFHYHMYGLNMGTLNVYRGSQKIWKLSRNQGNSWHSANVTLIKSNKTPPSQIIFEAVHGSDHRCDIAIDDIRIGSSSC